MDGATDERGAKTAAPSDPHTLRSALCAVSMAVPVVAVAWALGRTDRALFKKLKDTGTKVRAARRRVAPRGAAERRRAARRRSLSAPAAKGAITVREDASARLRSAAV